MNVSLFHSRWSQAVEDFVSGLGLSGLHFSPDHPLRFQFGTLGELNLESRPDGGVMICMSCPYTIPEEKIFQQALRICHPSRRKMPFPIKVGLCAGDRLVFSVFPDVQASERTTLEKALQVLLDLHEQAAQ